MKQAVNQAFSGAKKIFKRSIIISAVSTLSAAATVIAVDHWQKRDIARSQDFPHLPPQDVTIGDTNATVYTYGEDLFNEMLTAIKNAQTSIYLESYIWKSDEYGREFKDAVIDAAHRGVDVYLVYDSFANLVVPKKFLTFPANIHVLAYPVFRPQILLFDLKYTGRDHRKILVVDEEIGFVGGYNIGTTYANQWRDTHLRITGTGVSELTSAFVTFWNHNRRDNLPVIETQHTPDWLPKIQAAANAPIRQVYPVRNIYLEAFRRANHHIYLTQAYFIPDAVFLDELLAAAARGVDVRIIVPEASNHVLTDWLSRGQYSKMLKGGITIWLYRNTMVHAKTGTVDGKWTTIGTANIDRLSLQGNYEINMSIYDTELAETMERVFETDLSNCRQLDLEQWENRSFINKIGEFLLTPLSPLL
ncbi:phospholipase D-like domain-containing protein [Timonella sp. A28]|uniref:phospholipase D-like domain-containing protein n=1 Tax=Timonella sp. A28 TaxID=3442640 RepID=UPI003EB9FF06